MVCADGDTCFMSATFACSFLRARFMSVAPRVPGAHLPSGLRPPTSASPAGSLASDGAPLETADCGALLAAKPGSPTCLCRHPVGIQGFRIYPNASLSPHL